MVCSAGTLCPELADDIAAKSCHYCYPSRAPTMSEHTSGATVPSPLQGSALPPDWHLICCDEDHGSSSRTPYQQANDSHRRPKLRSSEVGPSMGSFAWMSCCEDEACVSRPADEKLRHHQHGYNAFSGQQSQQYPHHRSARETSCDYNERISQMCCTADSNVGGHGSAFSDMTGNAFGSHVDPKSSNGMRSASRSTSRPRVGECPPDTICCESTHQAPITTPFPRPEQYLTDSVSMDCSEEGCCDMDEFVCQDHDMVGACTVDHGIDFGPGFGFGFNAIRHHGPTVGRLPNSDVGNPHTSTFSTTQPRPQNDPFAALLSAVVQDATNSGILQMANSSTPSNTPHSSSASNMQHTRTASLAQMLEQQQKQLSGNVFLDHNQQLLQFQQAQHEQSQSMLISPSTYPYPPFSSPSQPPYMASSEISRQPQLPSRNTTQQNAADFSSPSALTSSSNVRVHDSACACASGHSSQSGASSVIQTPSPLLDGSVSNTAPHPHSIGSSSSTDIADCPAKKVTKGDCQDHAHVRGQPVLHVCHWQNCHASFTTVQNLLHHISQSHLGLNISADESEGLSPPSGPSNDQVLENINLGRKVSAGASPNDGSDQATMQQHSQHAYMMTGLSGNPDVTTILDNMLMAAAFKFDDRPQRATTQANNQPFMGMGDSVTYPPFPNPANQAVAELASPQVISLDGRTGLPFHAGLQEPATANLASNSTNTGNGGPMTCLWDDCPPFDPFAHFGQQCLVDTCGLPPSDVGNTALNNLPADQPIDTMMLTCDPTCAQDHTHLFPCEPACDQSHTHVYPMHLHSYSPAHPSHPHNVQLDSASAVLRHLLQQHLGVDLTEGLLNVASQQLDDVSALPTSNYAHASSTSSAPITRRPSTEKHACPGAQRKCKPLRAPPRKAAEDATLASQTHACRWHGCIETFESVEDLTEHLSDVHVGKGKTEYECLWAGCETCEANGDGDGGDVPKGRKFSTRQKVMRHMQAHTGYRPFVCPICGTAVSEQATLVAHIRRHSEDRPFHCDWEGCGKTFASAASLAVHKRTHEGQKEHVCPHCDKGFVEASNLNKHIRTHTGEKPFKCRQPGCIKKFSRPDQLKRHAQIHERTGKNSVAASENATSDTEESA